MTKDYLMEKWDNLDFYDKRSIVFSIVSYNVNLIDLGYFENNQEFFDMFYSDKPMKLASAICNGNYNINDEYVKIDDYGDLQSANKYEIEKEYEDYKEEIINLILKDTDDNYGVKEYFN